MTHLLLALEAVQIATRKFIANCEAAFAARAKQEQAR